MQKQLLLRQDIFVLLTLVLAIYPISLFLALFFQPAPLANIIGFLALLNYVATLLPSLLKIVFPSVKKSKLLTWLIKYRRHIGVTAFCLGLNHGVLIVVERKLNLLEWHTFITYFQGISTLLIFTLLATTSYDQAVKHLKKNWKKLHRLTYLVIFILPWHILDKMSGHWTYLTPFAVLITVSIAILFMIRRSKERVKVSQT